MQGGLKAIMWVVMLSGLLGGCYRIPIQQGNVLGSQDVAAIHPGMSADAVVARLGTPVLTNMFVNDQFIYVYTFKPSVGYATQQRLILHFQNGHVTHVQTDMQPLAAPVR